MLESHHLFMGFVAVLLSIATVMVSVFEEDSISDAISGEDVENSAKWGIVIVPATFLTWAAWGISAFSIEVQTSCCTRTASQDIVGIFGLLMAVVFFFIFIVELVEAFS